MENFKGILESIPETMKSLVSLVQMVAELIREKKWVELICLILGIVIIGWVSWEPIKSIFKIEEYPQWFILGCLGGILLFCVAVLIAVFNKPKLISDSPVEEQVAIKGLRPFTQKDAEVFSKLERNKSINACLSMLQDREFRIGILWGESGCGKSSLIQAGLMPKLTTEESQYRGIYIKFSDKNTLETVKKEIIRHLKLNSQETENLDFLGVCEQGIKTVGKPLILFFDQFEQVFVHRYKFTDVYEQFSDSLKQWYEQDKIDVKILMCLRSDLFYFQSDIQNKLNYPLYSSNSFELKKFSAEEATNILGMIASIEKIEFERDYIKYLFETNFMSKDNLISPVDLQILSLVISSQKISEKRAFKKTALQKIGEIEGLLYQYLEELLKLREQSTSKSQKEKLMKVLLEFVDGNELTRSGAFTIRELQENLKPIPPQEISEAINWLALERLITPSQHEDETAYELAHEKMIPAVMKLSGKILPKAYKANELLKKKVRVWMENNYSPRYLLGIGELWFIESHKRYLIWGNKERQKQRFLQQSKRRLYRNLGILGTILLLFMTGWGWLHYTTPGQLWQIRQELAYWGEEVRDNEYQKKFVLAFAKDGQINHIKALLDNTNDSLVVRVLTEVSNKLSDSTEAVALLKYALIVAQQIDHTFHKALALAGIASASSELSDNTEAVNLLRQVLTVAQEIDSSRYKAIVLTAMAEAYIKLSDSTEALTVLKQALSIAEESYTDIDKADILESIARASIKLSDSTEAVNVLKEALTIAKQINDDDSGNKASTLQAIAQASSQLSDTTEAVILLKETFTVAKQINYSLSKVELLEEITQAYIKLSDSTEAATVLKQLLTIAKQTDDPLHKASTLAKIAKASSELSDNKEAVALLKQALRVAEQIDDSGNKAWALTAIAKASSELSESTEALTLLTQALSVARQIDDSRDKVNALKAIAEASSELSETTEAIILLKQALTLAQEIDFPNHKASALIAIAQAYIKLSARTEAVNVFQEAVTVAEQIYDATNSYTSEKAKVLTTIAQASSELSDSTEAVTLLTQVFTVTQQIDSSHYQTEVLTAIAQSSSQLSYSTEAVTLLKQVLTVASDKANGLKAIIQGYIELSESTEDITFLQQAFTVAQQIDSSYTKAEVLEAITQGYITLSDKTKAINLLKQASTVAQQIDLDSSEHKAKALTAIAQGYIKLSDKTKAINLLKQASTVAQQIDPSYNKAETLEAIAQGYIKLSDETKAINLLKQASTVAQQMNSSHSKAEVLTAITEAQANLQQWGDALHTTKQCPSYDCRVESLSKVLTVYAELKNPELKDEEE